MQKDWRGAFAKGRSVRSRPRRITTTSPGSTSRSNSAPIRSNAQVSLATTQAPPSRAERERPEAVRIARRDQRVVGEHHEAEGALHARERVDQAVLEVRLARAREQVHDHLRVGARGEDRAAALELAADRAGVHQIAVVRDRERTAVGGRAERLRVAQARLAGRRVAHVADRVPARQLAQDLLVEDVGDEAHRAVHEVLAPVRGRDAGALLAAVLERVEAEVGEVRRLGMAVHAEDAAGVVIAVQLAFAREALRGFVADEALEGGAHCEASSRRGIAPAQASCRVATAVSIHAGCPTAPITTRSPPVVPMRRAGTPAARAPCEHRIGILARDQDPPGGLAEELHVHAHAAVQLDAAADAQRRGPGEARTPRARRRARHCATSCAVRTRPPAIVSARSACRRRSCARSTRGGSPASRPRRSASHSLPPSSSRVSPSSTIASPARVQCETAWRSASSSRPTTAMVGVGKIARPLVSL